MGNPLPHNRIVNGKWEVLPSVGQTRPGLNRVRASRSNWQNYLVFRIVVGQGAGSCDPRRWPTFGRPVHRAWVVHVRSSRLTWVLRRFGTARLYPRLTPWENYEEIYTLCILILIKINE
jgi:hypothetical protein